MGLPNLNNNIKDKLSFLPKVSTGEPTLNILTKKWSETVENSMRYDCIVLSPARQRREINEGVGASGWREWGVGGGGRVER